MACTHGHEVGWSMVPGARQLLRRIADTNDVLTFISRYSRRRISPALGPSAALEYLPPGVDSSDVPRRTRRPVRRSASSTGSATAPTVVCVSRLVPRKGQDALIRSWPRSWRRSPTPALLIVGGGRYGSTLDRLIERNRLQHSRASHWIGTGPTLRRVLRGGRCVRHAVPDPGWRAGRRGTRHRVPRGVGHRPAGDRRRLRWCARDGADRNRPDWSWTAGTRLRWPPRVCGCCPTRQLADRLGRAGRTGCTPAWTWTNRQSGWLRYCRDDHPRYSLQVTRRWT